MSLIKIGLSCAAAGLMVLAGSLALQADATKNPDEERLEQATLDFVTWCGPCHGASGRGDGPVASDLVNKPPDLTLLTLKFMGKFPEKQVRMTIDGRAMPSSHGTREMPVWGAWFRFEAEAGGLLQDQQAEAEAETRERIERLVGYIRLLQRAK